MSFHQNIKKGLIPARLTIADVYALQASGVIDEGEKFELINGEIVPMAAAKSGPHERMKSQLIRALAFVSDDVRLFVEPTVAFIPTQTAEPDLAVWPKQIESEEVRGPDLLLAIEVAVSSLPYDLREKAARYAFYGTRDYWVVDAIRRTIRVHRSPNGERFLDVEEYGAADRVSPLLLPGIAIALDELD